MKEVRPMTLRRVLAFAPLLVLIALLVRPAEAG
jgi:hypothetical protein